MNQGRHFAWFMVSPPDLVVGSSVFDKYLLEVRSCEGLKVTFYEEVEAFVDVIP